MGGRPKLVAVEIRSSAEPSASLSTSRGRGPSAGTRSPVRDVVANTPMKGTTRNIPAIPATAAPAGIASRTMAGWIRPGVGLHRPGRRAAHQWAAALSSAVLGSIDLPRLVTLSRIQASGIGRNQ